MSEEQSEILALQKKLKRVKLGRGALVVVLMLSWYLQIKLMTSDSNSLSQTNQELDNTKIELVNSKRVVHRLQIEIAELRGKNPSAKADVVVAKKASPPKSIHDFEPIGPITPVKVSKTESKVRYVSVPANTDAFEARIADLESEVERLEDQVRRASANTASSQDLEDLADLAQELIQAVARLDREIDRFSDGDNWRDIVSDVAYEQSRVNRAARDLEGALP